MTTFSNTAGRKLSLLATSCLVPTTRVAGLETTPKTLTTSMGSLPHALSTTTAMDLEGSSMETCSFTAMKNKQRKFFSLIPKQNP